ncbi:hypothetical protein D3C76_1157070 [compost metagenome]
MAFDALRYSPGLFDAFIKQAQHLSCRCQKVGSSRRERHAAIGAFKQRSADLMLQPTNSLTQRGLCHMQPLRCAIEVQFLGDGDELM